MSRSRLRSAEVGLESEHNCYYRVQQNQEAFMEGSLNDNNGPFNVIVELRINDSVMASEPSKQAADSGADDNLVIKSKVNIILSNILLRAEDVWTQ